jgi:hypothetical protein
MYVKLRKVRSWVAPRGNATHPLHSLTRSGFASAVQKTNVYALQVVVGTDIKVVESTGGDKVHFVNLLTQYKPNLHVECHDRILGGQIGVSTTKNEARSSRRTRSRRLAV